MKKTIHAANILFNQMPEITNEETTTMTSGTEELETRRANWDKWPMQAWPEEIKDKLRQIMEKNQGRTSTGTKSPATKSQTRTKEK